jgi:hypothetical protein
MKRRGVAALLTITAGVVLIAASPASQARGRITLAPRDTFYVPLDRRRLTCTVVPGRPPSLACLIGDRAGPLPGSYSVALSDRLAAMLKINPQRLPRLFQRFLQPPLTSRPFATVPSARPPRVVALGTNTLVIIGGSHVACLQARKGVLGCSLLDSTGHELRHTYQTFISDHLASIGETGPPGSGRVISVFDQPK